jgi:hypothetical protein
MAEARAPDLRDMYTRQGMQVKNGGITLSANGYIKGGKTAYATGTGFFLGYSGGAYKFDIGSGTSYLRWTGTALSLIGDITGVSSIDITGTAKFGGAYTGAYGQAAVYANEGATSYIGVVGIGGNLGFGVYGHCSNGWGVAGNSSTGIGVTGTSTSGTAGYFSSGGTGTNYGLHAVNTSTGYALYCQGPMKMSDPTVVTNLNADKLDGNDATAFATAGHNHTGTYLPIAGTAADSTLFAGNPVTAVPVYNTTTAGDPGAPTHTVTMVLGGLNIRFHVSYP